MFSAGDANLFGGYLAFAFVLPSDQLGLMQFVATKPVIAIYSDLIVTVARYITSTIISQHAPFLSSASYCFSTSNIDQLIDDTASKFTYLFGIYSVFPNSISSIFSIAMGSVMIFSQIKVILIAF